MDLRRPKTRSEKSGRSLDRSRKKVTLYYLSAQIKAVSVRIRTRMLGVLPDRSRRASTIPKVGDMSKFAILVMLLFAFAAPQSDSQKADVILTPLHDVPIPAIIQGQLTDAADVEANLVLPNKEPRFGVRENTPSEQSAASSASVPFEKRDASNFRSSS